MRHRRRRFIAEHPSVDLDREPYGGHNFDQIEDHEDEADYFYRCSLCGGVVSGWEIEQGVWPARVGRSCPEVLMGAKQ